MLGFAALFGASCDNASNWATQEAAKRVPAPERTIAADDDRGEAVFAGGCFWCVEAVFERIAGVREVVSGYAGGKADTADYDAVSSGATNHAEVVCITYEPQQVRYDQLLHVFFATHDPTQKDRQGPDVGKQYRSAVFYADEHQRRVAEAYIAQLNDANALGKPIVTTLEPLEAFYPAEDYHQDFVEKHPRHPYVQQWAVPKLHKLEKQFDAHLKPD
ncbi:MAG: peptide-methionine (S)-S-oxide reductase MsrA [Phycisphaeraceae bacterium]